MIVTFESITKGLLTSVHPVRGLIFSSAPGSLKGDIIVPRLTRLVQKGGAKEFTADDEKTELAGKTAESNARIRERARCAAIIGAGEKCRKKELAMHFAFQTNLPRGQAIEALQKASAASSAVGYGRFTDSAEPQGAPASWDEVLRAAKH